MPRVADPRDGNWAGASTSSAKASWPAAFPAEAHESLRGSSVRVVVRGSGLERHLAARLARDRSMFTARQFAHLADQIIRIIFADLVHDGGNVGLGRIGQFNQRQANLR